MKGDEALERLLADYPDVKSILDVGSGRGEQAAAMRSAGRCVMTVSLQPPADIVADYMQCQFPPTFDALWICHVLEHQPNVGAFLKHCFSHLREGGVLAVTVPPLKHQIVGGHLTLWNAGLLLYNLILAGFDCAAARVGVYGYNLSVLVRKHIVRIPQLAFDAGDIETLARFFPVPVRQGFDGRLDGGVAW